ncbi:ribose-5-phosphate isomerase RpiA [Listeria booriae]|uniref:ribose-5-phosphate isomerase RpiA n=1 Tax=Listeria booriae TaxID=1552123 RepID=UPI0016253349|nr:ribose-5-phosphate isomerase RpiA [Listeria booriae]MBC1512162.1 ribose-5-phosphate isomerase RpiA [Listeria booriae]MBC1559255.1 ribose-5-phosphate isomerase RpiA [Listeria booriae]MBC2265169.1 ribose-5-phosphate isomerase RpiA [Listeria booriae]MBC6150704.1 ribose-5-phosphate isomerase RpiA [Listeria booriae]MBC6306552.1 ribose-5-phosphate isomerase RpiA [Listeria booriae]
MNSKQIAGEKACEFIEDGMVVGLGTGSTAYYMIQKLGDRVAEGLQVTGVVTSKATEKLAKERNIPLMDLNDVGEIDLTIDGADEVDGSYRGIKGGGGALLFEKLVAHASKKSIWVVGEDKVVETLGAFPLPVEVVPFGYKQVERQLEERGYKPELRHFEDGSIYLTDSQNYILDLHIQAIENPEELNDWLNNLPGVVENGLFLNYASSIVIGYSDGRAEVREK